MEQKIKAYKAFDKDLSCRGFKYEVGKEYEETGDIKACEKGFHACPYPLDVFSYYTPAGSRFCEVYQGGKIDDSESDKVCSSKIRIGAELDIKGLVKAAVSYVKVSMLGSIRMAKKMNKEEFLSKRYAIDLKIKKLNGEKEQLEKEYIESNQVFPIGSKVCITVMAHKRNNERILVPEAKKLAYIADYDIDDNGEVVPSLRQLDCNGGMSAIPLFVNLKKAIIELV